MAGEVADGIEAPSSMRANSEYVVEHVRIGAERSGRNPEALRMGASAIVAVSDDGAAAKAAALAVALAWLPGSPPRMLARHGLDEDHVAPILAAVEEGDFVEAVRRAGPAVGEALTIAGSPEECADRIRTDLVDAGMDDVLLAVVDPTVTELATGIRPDGLPDAPEQLRLIRDQVFPSFERT